MTYVASTCQPSACSDTIVSTQKGGFSEGYKLVACIATPVILRENYSCYIILVIFEKNLFFREGPTDFDLGTIKAIRLQSQTAKILLSYRCSQPQFHVRKL